MEEYKIENIILVKQEEKKGRGRPKKMSKNEDEVLEVIKYLYKDEIYLKTKENILLDINTYNIVGQIIEENKVELW